MKHHFLLLPLLCLVVSCKTPPQQIALENYSGTIRIACVGDSITYGAGVENRETNNYPSVLGRLLGPKFKTENFGVSGATLLRKGDKPYWDLPELQRVADFQPDIVVLKLGTNDSKPQNWAHRAEFESDLRAMIRRFRTRRTRVYLCTPAPVYETRYGINEQTVRGEIVPILLRVADQENIPVIDLHSALSGHPEMFPDQIHPNAAGARLMAETVKKALAGS